MKTEKIKKRLRESHENKRFLNYESYLMGAR